MKAAPPLPPTGGLDEWLAVERWASLGRRLKLHDPARFERLLAAGRAYLASDRSPSAVADFLAAFADLGTSSNEDVS